MRITVTSIPSEYRVADWLHYEDRFWEQVTRHTLQFVHRNSFFKPTWEEL